MSNSIAVSITADTSDLLAKRAVLSAALNAASKDLRGFAETARASGGGTDQLKASMLAAAGEVARTRAQVAALDAQMKALKLSSAEAGRSLFGGLKEGLESVKGSAESLGAIQASVMGIGEAVGAAFALSELAEWARKMGEAGEQTEHTAQMLGTSVGTVQQLGAAFTLMGVDTDKGVTGIERLDKAFAMARQGGKAQAEVFKELGVSTAQNYTQVQLLGAVMEGFAKQADGPAKAAEAMALFGRSGAALIPFLDLGAAGMSKLNDVTSEYGVVNESAVAKSALLGEAFNENKVAMAGVGNVLAQEFAPAMTVAVQAVNKLIASWIESYQRGGDVKLILDALDATFKTVIGAIGGLGLAFDEQFQAIKLVVNSFSATWKLVVDAAEGEAGELGDSFVRLGRVIYDELSNNIMAAANDMKSAEDKMAADAAATSAKIRGDMALIGKAAAPDWAKMKADAAAYYKFLGDLGGGKAAPAPIKPTGEGGDTGGDPAKGARAKRGGKQEDPTQAAMSADTDEWQHIADMAVVITGNADADMLAAETSFWAKKLRAAKQGSDLWFAILEKLNPLVVRGEEVQVKAIEDGVNAEIEVHKKGLEAQKAFADEAVKYIEMIVEKEVAAHKKGAEEQAKAWREANSEILSAESQLIGGIFSGRQSLGQMLSEIALSTAQKEIVADIQYFTQKRLLAAEGQAADEATARGGLLVQMVAERQKTEAVVVGSAAQVAAKTSAASQTLAISKATGLQEVFADARVAAASAYKAMAGIPVIGPELGAVAAAATFAGVMAFGSFDRGVDVVPTDFFGLVHAGERIIPASDNHRALQGGRTQAPRSGGAAHGGRRAADGGRVHLGPTSGGQYLRRRRTLRGLAGVDRGQPDRQRVNSMPPFSAAPLAASAQDLGTAAP